MSRTTLLLVAFFILNTSLFGQSKSIEELDQYFEKAVKDWNIPGVSIGIIKDGKTILAKGYGVLEEGSTTKVNEHTNYSIASNTKAFTVALLGILVDEGKISWDDKVIDYLPSFRMEDAYEQRHITIRDLLCHRVGYGSFSGDVVWYKSTRSASEVVKSVPNIPKLFDFRSGYGYSNMMYITAGQVIEAVTGESWVKMLNKRILTPLNMDRTLTSVNQLTTIDNNATPHKPSKDGNTPIPWVNWDNMGTGGAIISNVDDMLKWMQLQLDHGKMNGQEVFSNRVQEDWWTPHNSFKVGSRSKEMFPSKNFGAYGLGWSILDYHGRKVVRHGGGYDGMYSQVVLVPEENMGIIILTNSMKSIGSWLPYRTMDVLFGKETKDWSKMGLDRYLKGASNTADMKNDIVKARVKNTTPSVSNANLTGTYQDDLYKRDIKIQNTGNSLRLTFEDAPGLSATLKHWHFDTYEIVWDEPQAWFDFGTLQFIKDNNNQVTGMEFDVPNHDIFFHEMHPKKIK